MHLSYGELKNKGAEVDISMVYNHVKNLTSILENYKMVLGSSQSTIEGKKARMSGDVKFTGKEKSLNYPEVFLSSNLQKDQNGGFQRFELWMTINMKGIDKSCAMITEILKTMNKIRSHSTVEISDQEFAVFLWVI